ncbi:TPA: glycosyl transferase, partial [Candidatus Peribacteria bacterium]|nr:glycosyl transferase [Candidatus Peribacteria bacterium]
VGTCFGGTPEIVVSGETGFIVNPRNTLGYAQALVKLLNNPDLAGEMGRKGNKRVKMEFSLEKQADAYLGLFR